MAMDIGSLVAFLELDDSKFEKGAKDVGGKLPGWMAAAGAVAAVAVAAAFSAAFVNAVNIDAGNDKLAGQLALTEEESQRAGEAAAGAYANAFGDSMETVQGTTAGVISSIQGMREASVDELQGIVEKVQTLSDAFGIESDRISQVVGQMLSTGMASSAQEGVDLLTAVLQQVPSAVREDVLDAVDEYGPFFQQIGISGTDAMNMLVQASEKGMYGIDKTGDAVKEFGIRATDMSALTTGVYETLGLDAVDMSNKLLAGGETAKGAFDTIVDGLLGIQDPSARANAAIALFGTPLEDIGVNEIPTFLEALKGGDEGMGNFAGSAEKLASTMSGNVASSWEGIMRHVEMFATQIAAQLLPVLEAVFQWMSDNPTVVQALGVALGVLTAVVLGLAAALWVASLTPITLIIAAIIVGVTLLVAAITWLVLNWDAVWAWIAQTFEGFVGWFNGVMEGFVTWWNGMWEGFASWVVQVWEGFIGWIEGVWSGFVGWLQGVGDGLASWWNGLWAGIGAWIQSVWEGIVSWVNGVVSGFVAWLISAFLGYIAFWSNLWTTVSDGVRNAWNGIIDFFSGIPDRILGFFSGIGTWLINAGEDLIQGFIDGIGNMIGAVGDAVSGVLDFVGGFFPHSPAKHGPFSGSGWTQLLASGGALMDQFTDGMLARDPFSDERITAALSGDWGSDAPAPVERVPAAQTVIYNAAENQSLTAEEALFAALGSPRSPFGGN